MHNYFVCRSSTDSGEFFLSLQSHLMCAKLTNFTKQLVDNFFLVPKIKIVWMHRKSNMNKKNWEILQNKKPKVGFYFTKFSCDFG